MMKSVAARSKRTTVLKVVSAFTVLTSLAWWWLGGRDQESGNQQSTTKVDDYRVSFWTARSKQNDVDYLSRVNLGFAYIDAARHSGDLGLYQTAEAVLGEALELNPHYAPALAALSATHLARHDFSKALTLAKQAYKLDPASLEALAAMGDAQLELGYYDKAAVSFELLHRRLPGPAAEARLARLAFHTGRRQEAIERARTALKLAENSPDPSYRIALATYSANKTSAPTMHESGLTTEPEGHTSSTTSE